MARPSDTVLAAAPAAVTVKNLGARMQPYSIHIVQDALVIRWNSDLFAIIEIDGVLGSVLQGDSFRVLILNLQRVRYFTAESAGSLAILQALLRRTGRQLRICPPICPVTPFLESLRLQRLFRTFESESQALSASADDESVNDS